MERNGMEWKGMEVRKKERGTNRGMKGRKKLVHNMLKLNCDKTELLVMYAHHHTRPSIDNRL
jgi:hypothetical protein